MANKIYRQGDVALIKREIPAAAKPKPRAGDVILALGEVTGHAHRIRHQGVRVFEHEGTRFIRVPKRGASLRHEEHGRIAVEGGEYEVRIQREYSPEEIRNVQD